MSAFTKTSDMIRLAGGEFTMGSTDFYPEEAPLRRVRVAAFLLDATPVTNAQFAAFVEHTGYVTLAERVPDPADYPSILPEMIVAGSIVFKAPPRGQPVGPESWWSYLPGANWRHPYGSELGAIAPSDHPVVHVAYGDAVAFARWAGKRLPTEVEAEFALRGGLIDATYGWGMDLLPGGRPRANIWYEGFPHSHPEHKGPPYTTPVTQYPPNAYGLFDLTGNTWEWTSSDASGPVGNNSCCHSVSQAAYTNPAVHKVLKGGSHLCAPNYCRRYRPAAKWFQPVDTSTTHVGFRCAQSLP
jgi:sulfatase modifying factor 1